MPTDFIEERSRKVIAVVAVINSLEFGEAEFAELTKYLAIQCGFGHLNNLLTIDDLNTLNEFYELGEPETVPELIDKPDIEPFDGDGYDRYIENLITDIDDDYDEDRCASGHTV